MPGVTGAPLECDRNTLVRTPWHRIPRESMAVPSLAVSTASLAGPGSPQDSGIIPSFPKDDP